MPELPVPQAALVQCLGQVDAQLTINTLHFVNSGGVTEQNLTTLTNDVRDWFINSLAPLLSQDWSTQRVIGIDLSSLTGPRVEAGFTFPGGTAGEAAPNNVAACVSLRTAQRGRSGRGRNFVPGIPNTAVTLNTLDTPFITSLLTVYGDLIGAGTFSTGWQLCIVSRFSGKLQRTPPITIPVTSVTMVGNKVRSMRSREVGHGA